MKNVIIFIYLSVFLGLLPRPAQTATICELATASVDSRFAPQNYQIKSVTSSDISSKIGLLLIIDIYKRIFYKDRAESQAVVMSNYEKFEQHSDHVVITGEKSRVYEKGFFNPLREWDRPISSVEHNEVHGYARITYKKTHGMERFLPLEADYGGSIFSTRGQFKQVIEISRAFISRAVPKAHRRGHYIAVLGEVLKRVKRGEENDTLIVLSVHSESRKRLWESFGFKATRKITLANGETASILEGRASELILNWNQKTQEFYQKQFENLQTPSFSSLKYQSFLREQNQLPFLKAANEKGQSLDVFIDSTGTKPVLKTILNGKETEVQATYNLNHNGSPFSVLEINIWNAGKSLGKATLPIIREGAINYEQMFHQWAPDSKTSHIVVDQLQSQLAKDFPGSSVQIKSTNFQESNLHLSLGKSENIVRLETTELGISEKVSLRIDDKLLFPSAVAMGEFFKNELLGTIHPQAFYGFTPKSRVETDPHPARHQLFNPLQVSMHYKNHFQKQLSFKDVFKELGITKSSP